MRTFRYDIYTTEGSSRLVSTGIIEVPPHSEFGRAYDQRADLGSKRFADILIFGNPTGLTMELVEVTHLFE